MRPGITNDELLAIHLTEPIPRFKSQRRRGSWNRRSATTNLLMSTFTSFAVIGAGDIGKLIVEALVAQKVSVVLFTRPSSTVKKNIPGAKTVVVEYADQKRISQVLTENRVEVIISSVGNEGIPTQRIFADAAKTAGSKLFVPSEYGMPTHGTAGTESLLASKDSFAGQYAI